MTTQLESILQVKVDNVQIVDNMTSYITLFCIVTVDCYSGTGILFITFKESSDQNENFGTCIF